MGKWVLPVVTVGAVLVLGAAWAARLPPVNPVVELVVLGEPEPDLDLEMLAAELAHKTGARVEVSGWVPLPPDAYEPAWERHNADVILDALARNARPETWKVLGLTTAGLLRWDGEVPSPVMGSGKVRGRAAVVSTQSLEARSMLQASVQRRVTSVALHELGHTLGLRHCAVGGCVMGESHGDSVVWADMGRADYCVLCRLKAGGDVLPAPAVASAALLQPRQ